MRESIAHELAAPSVARHSCTLDVSVTASQLPRKLNWTCCTGAPMSRVAVMSACSSQQTALMFLHEKPASCKLSMLVIRYFNQIGTA